MNIGSGTVGIITLPGEYNYGNRLQLYAQIKVFKSFGFNAESLELRQKNSHLLTVKNVVKKALGRPLEEDTSTFTTSERQEAFRRFGLYIPTQVFDKPTDVPVDEYAFFSTGSDQVWNPSFISSREGENPLLRLYHLVSDKAKSTDFLDWYCLGFCPSGKRIALAPSIGLDFVDAAQSELIRRGANNFSHLSVREHAGSDIIKSCSGKNARIICDPTLTLGDEEWRSIAEDTLNPKDPYIFTYLLGGMGSSAGKVIHGINDRAAMPIVHLTDRARIGEVPAGPAEFISLIDNAAHVVTDSFHAAVFASILQTPLSIVRREGPSSMFSRLETLCQMLGIENKIVGSPEFELSKADDFGGVPEAIARERHIFMEYLGACLNA